jgi:c-di-GMP phosphodiesterase
MENPFFTRQAIYNSNLEVIAYDLLFRQNEYNCADIGKYPDTTNSVITSTKVMIHSIVDIGLENIANNLPLYIKITPSLLDHVELIDLNYPIVLDLILENKISDSFIERLDKLKAIGYKIAINDYFEASLNDLSLLIPLIDIIKVDVSTLSKANILECIEELTHFNADILLKNIENQKLFEQINDYGANFYQGFFLGSPSKINSQSVGQNNLVLLHLLAKLNRPSLSFEEISNLVSQDVALSYKILRISNSAMYGTTLRKIESINEAVIRLGINTVKFWANLLALSGMSNKSMDLLTTTLIRANMCRYLALEKGADEKRSDTYFTVGLLSTIDALLCEKMDDILVQLPLSDELNDALLEKKGKLGIELNNVIAYEMAKYDDIICDGIPAVTYKIAYIKSIQWANKITNSFSL